MNYKTHNEITLWMFLFGVTLLMIWPKTAKAITLDMVTVGNPGNAGELSGESVPGGYGPDRVCGAVDYNYNIGKYEVTAGQYAAFLNAVAATDTYGLFNLSMWLDIYGCRIQRAGSSGHYTYSLSPNYADRPVNFVSWGDAARFCNWLQNGQPTGSQGLSTTEDGAYFLNGATSQSALMAVTRKAGATWVIPTENEWYKAAYYDPNKDGPGIGGYWDYPTGTDLPPGRDMTEVTNPGNNANCVENPNSPMPIDSGTYYTTIVGEFQLSRSPYGTFDQSGNVWEWNETAFSGSKHGWRGGGFNFDRLHSNASDGSCIIDPSIEYMSCGFRVAYVPEPSSITLMTFGAVYLLRRLISRNKRPRMS